MTADPLLMGIDAGTSRVRALVFTTDGTVVAEGAAAADVRHPQPGWADYEAEDLWQAAVSAIGQAVADTPEPSRIAGLAVASVGESGIPVDAAGQPVTRALAWYDTRPSAETQALADRFGEALTRRTGMRLDPTAGLCKMLWMRANRADDFARAKRWLNVADYIAWRLSGAGATEHTLASRMLLLDQGALAWADDAAEAVGIDPALLQPLTANGTGIGTVRPEVAAETGLPSHCVVATGGHDHAVGGLAVGLFQAGTMLDSMGTAEALALTMDTAVASDDFVSVGLEQAIMHLDRPMYYLMGGLMTAGGAVEWARSIVAADADRETLIAAAADVPAGSHGVHFLPHLRLGSPPFVDARDRGAFLGLNGDVTGAVMYRAVLEGVAYDVRNIAETMQAQPGAPRPGRIIAIGGGTLNPLQVEIKASIYNQPVEIVEMPESVSLGAAILGGIGAGVYASLADALDRIRPAVRSIAPNPDWTDLYEARFREVYQPARAALRPLHHALV